MPEIRVAAAAEEDLHKVWEYVAQNNPEAAGKLIKEITRNFAVLRDFPQMGREQTRLLIGLRSFVVREYVIFYQPFESGIEVLRVMHGSRDIEKVFADFLDSL